MSPPGNKTCPELFAALHFWYCCNAIEIPNIWVMPASVCPAAHQYDLTRHQRFPECIPLSDKSRIYAVSTKDAWRDGRVPA